MSDSKQLHVKIIRALALAILPHLESYHSLATADRSQLEAGDVKMIGEEVRMLRRRAKFSREGMAMKTGIDKELIVLVENGYGDKDTAEFVLGLARTLK